MYSFTRGYSRQNNHDGNDTMGTHLNKGVLFDQTIIEKVPQYEYSCKHDETLSVIKEEL